MRRKEIRVNKYGMIFISLSDHTNCSYSVYKYAISIVVVVVVGCIVVTYSQILTILNMEFD